MIPQVLEKETTKYDPAKNSSETEMKLSRKYDIIVFGASGFTGQYVAIEMANVSKTYNLSWAVAGRNLSKLQMVLDDIYKTLNSIIKIDIIYADVQDFKTIIEMTKCTSVIINCVGPYYMYAEVVVKYCVLNSTHYVDVTGESLFMEKMAYLYNSQAEKNCSLIVNALGMESVPADLGVEYLFKHFSGDLQTVDIYMELYNDSSVRAKGSLIHDGTWASIILHLSTRKLRIYYRNLLDRSMGIIRDKNEVDRIIHKQQISSFNEKKKWCLAFPEPDQALIVRSIHHAKTVDNLPYNFKVRSYMVFGSLITAICVLFTMIMLSFMAIYEPIRNFLVQFPSFVTLGIVSKTGPSKQIMEGSCLSLNIIGYGSTSVKPHIENVDTMKYGVNNRRKTIIKVEAKNPGYGFTSKAVVLGAVAILKDPNVPKGGVLTPAAAFRKSQYIKMLIEHRAAKFKIVSDIVVNEQQE